MSSKGTWLKGCDRCFRLRNKRSSILPELAVQHVKIIDCSSASEFLDYLAPRGKLFGQEAVGARRSSHDAWYYRGHSDDGYLLTASALRNTGSMSALGYRSCICNEEQVTAEIDSIYRFFNLADASGLALPEDSQTLRSVLDEIRGMPYLSRLEKGECTWPPKELWSLLGLAQHYGVPTRLLDWSHSSITSAYFAGQGAMKQLAAAYTRTKEAIGCSDHELLLLKAKQLGLEDPAKVNVPQLAEAAKAWNDYNNLLSKKVSVWAFRYERYLDVIKPSIFEAGSSMENTVAKVTVPHFQNPNLHAQDGLFTLIRTSLAGKLRDPVDRTPLDEHLFNELKKHKNEKTDWAYLCKVRLPWSEVSQLNWLLAVEGVSAATIYPGYKGVAMALAEESMPTFF